VSLEPAEDFLSPAGEPELRVVADPATLAREAAVVLCTELERAAARSGAAHLCLTGGSSAGALYSTLAADFQEAIDWRLVHLWWGDDRYVPPDHPESVAGLALDRLLAIAARTGESGEGAGPTDVRAGVAPGIDLPFENVHPIPIDKGIAHGPDGAAWAAERYAAEIRAHVPQGPDGWPRFDVVLLGVGADGHILSVFPDSPALEPHAPLVMPIPAPRHVEPRLARITLNPRILGPAGRVLAMVLGEGKAEIVPLVLGTAWEPSRWPAQLARRPNATWLLDEAAASRLPPGRRSH
jgi:6-phosphogluconolactonase